MARQVVGFGDRYTGGGILRVHVGCPIKNNGEFVA